MNDVPYLDEGTDQSNSSDDSVFEMLEEEASPIAKDQTDERIVFNDKDLSFNTAKSKDKSKSKLSLQSSLNFLNPVACQKDLIFQNMLAIS